jgi:GR25 family glycosyltransferase involved in LPS biosynthesis
MYQGFYINLARNATRRESLVRHLEERGVAARYRRFEAVDGHAVAGEHQMALDPGNVGCWLSHLQLLNANCGTDRHLHVIEDDAFFARAAASGFEAALKAADAGAAGWDLLFTEVFFAPEVSVFRRLDEGMKRYERDGTLSVLPLQRIAFAGTSSYFVNRQSVGKVADILEENRQAARPIDLFLRQAVAGRRLRAYVTVPFLTTLSPDNVESDIRSQVDRSRRVLDVCRRCSFVDADLRALHAELLDLTRGAAVPPRAGIFLHALSFWLSDQFVPF